MTTLRTTMEKLVPELEAREFKEWQQYQRMAKETGDLYTKLPLPLLGVNSSTGCIY